MVVSRAVRLLVVLALVLAACGNETEQADVDDLEPYEPFERAVIELRGPDDETVSMPVYVADEPETRQQGLMFVEDLQDDAGMIFVFPDETSGGFWMYNTLIPLSIAFLGPEGDVRAVLDMEPCESDDPSDCPSYDPGVGYQWALEVNQGFFDEVGLDEQWVVDIPDDLEATA